MTSSPAPFGLLLDVDGPIASPESRRIADPQITRDLLTLASAGIPIAFITGRSDAFMATAVIGPLVEGGLDEHSHVFGVFEKGGSWAEITPAGLAPLTIDHEVGFPADARRHVEALARNEYGHAMFVDETKRVMVSLEARTDVSAEVYRTAQSSFQAAAFELLADHAIGVRYGEHEQPDAAGHVGWRIDPTIISTDIESVLLDKDRGADRSLAWFAERGVSAEHWYSAGDSRSDYLMADAVHAAGLRVSHLDVRPADGMLEREYPVIVEGDLIHDAAGGSFLRRRVAELDT